MKCILISACLLGTCCRYDGGNNLVEAVEKLREIRGVRLVPVCPEVLGGLPIPRVPSERIGDRVKTRNGADVTDAFCAGARLAMEKAQKFECCAAVLKERSPSCGAGRIYDGTFTGTLTAGDGVFAELLRSRGIPVFGESQIEPCIDFLCGCSTAVEKE